MYKKKWKRFFDKKSFIDRQLIDLIQSGDLKLGLMDLNTKNMKIV